MIEKNHSQRNIYLHDLKNNTHNQKATALDTKSSSIVWLVVLVVAAIVIAATNFNNKKVNTNKTLGSTDTQDINIDAVDGIADRDTSSTAVTSAVVLDNYVTTAQTRSGLSQTESDRASLRALAQQLDDMSLAPVLVTGPQRDLFKVTKDSITLEPITDARYYPEDVLNGLPEQPAYNWITVKIKKGDSLTKIFDRLGLSHKDAIALASASNMKSLNYLTVGQKLEIKTTLENEFVSLKYDINKIKSIEINKQESGEIVSTIEELEPKTRIRDVTAPIQDNLFSTADDP